MKLTEAIRNEMTKAMKEKGKETLSTLRLLTAKAEKKRIESREPIVTDEIMMSSIKSNVKELEQEITALKNVNRDTSSQEVEKAVLSKYLPTLMSEEEIINTIDTLITGQEGDFGSIMKIVSPELRGKADMKIVTKVVKNYMEGSK